VTPNMLAGLAAIVTFILIVDLLRRGALKEKYAVLWLAISGVAFMFALFPQLLEDLTGWLGVQTPSNLVFFLTIVVLILVSVQLSYELGRHEARIRRLAEEIAIHDEQIKLLQQRDTE